MERLAERQSRLCKAVHDFISFVLGRAFLLFCRCLDGGMAKYQYEEYHITTLHNGKCGVVIRDLTAKQNHGLRRLLGIQNRTMVSSHPHADIQIST